MEADLYDEYPSIALHQRVSILRKSIEEVSDTSRSFASSVYTSGADDVSSHFGTSHTVSLLDLSLFLWGLGLGAIIAAPVSEHYRRRIAYLTTVPIFGLFILASGLAQNFHHFGHLSLFGRLLRKCSGLGGWRCKFRPLAANSRRICLSFLFSLTFSRACFWYGRPPPSIHCEHASDTNVLGPVIGGFVSEKKDFRWLDWVILFVVAFNYVYAPPQPDTYKKTILQRRAKSLKQSDASLVADSRPLSAVVQWVVLKPFKLLFVESSVLFMTNYMAFNLAVFDSFFAAFPHIFGDKYRFTPGQEGLTFVSIALGCVIGFV